MSLSSSCLAVRCDVDELQAAFLALWPAFEVAEPAQRFESFDSAYQWASPRSGYLEGDHPNDVKLIFRDNNWSVLADISMTMADDGATLAKLSHRLGRVMIATTQGTAGFAQLRVFEAGTDIRSITSVNGRSDETGIPLPEEAGISLDRFNLNELDLLWQRLGLSSFLQSDPAGPVVALHVLDRTPSPAAAARTLAPREVRRRPWWQFW
jgi:hypothetical protein